MRGYPTDFSDLAGGLNLRDEPELVPPGQSPDLFDVVPVAGGRGAIQTRPGTLLFDVAGLVGTPVVHSLVSDPNNNRMLVGFDDKLGSWTPGDTSGLLGSPNGFASREWHFAYGAPVDGFGPHWGLGNSAGIPEWRAWVGTSTQPVAWTARVGTLPWGNCIAWWQDRIWIGGKDGNTSTVCFSEIADPRNWPGNEVKIDPNDGDYIRCLTSTGPYLLAFKLHRTYVIYDDASGANRRLSGNIGCVGPRAAVETPLGVAFLTADSGVYLTNGTTTEPLSDQILPAFRALQPSQLATAVLRYWNGRLIVSIPSVGVIYDFDIQTRTWWRHTTTAADVCPHPQGTGGPIDLWAFYRDVATAHPYIGELFHGGVSDSISVGGQFAINSYWQSPALIHRLYRQIKAPAVRKRIRGVELRGSRSIDVSVLKDFSTDTNAFKRTVVLPLTSEGGGHVYTPGICREYALRFASSNGFTLDGFTVFADLKNN